MRLGAYGAHKSLEDSLASRFVWRPDLGRMYARAINFGYHHLDKWQRAITGGALGETWMEIV